MNLLKESIKNFPIVKELNENALTHLLNIIRLRHYKNHGQIFSQGTSLNEIHFILKGKVKIFNKDSSVESKLCGLCRKVTFSL